MAPPLPSSDSDLVVLAMGGRDDAFAALYERYFPPVFDFLTRLLHDRQEAADVAQDTFIRAMERLGGLEKPESFKSWLFTIAHRNGLNRLQRSKRSVAVAAIDDDDDRGLNPLLSLVDVDRYGDPESSAEAQAVATYVWEAAVGLDPRTYAVLDLHVRHGLGSAEIADVLGVTKGNAYTMVNRMKKSVAESLGTYLLARKGARDCAELSGILARTSLPPMTPDIRKAVDRHVKTCEVCEENRRALLVPLRIFAGLALVPPLPGIQEAIWASVSAAGAAASGDGKSGNAPTAAGAGGAGGAATAAASAAAGGAGGAGGAATGAGSAAAGGAGGTGGAAASAAAGGAGAGAGAVTAWWQAPLARIAAAAVITVAAAGGLWMALAGNDPAPVEVLSAGVTQPVGGGGDAAGGGAGGAGGAGSGGAATTTTTSPPTTTTTAPTTTTTTVAGGGSTGSGAVARNDDVSMAEDGTVTIDILANDTAVDPTTVSILSPPPGATILVDPVAGSVVFTPPRNAAGNFGFRYRVSGSSGGEVEAAVTVRVAAVNDAPIARNDNAVVAEDGSVLIDVLANDSDVDDPVADLTVVGSPQHGTATVVAGRVRYTPAADYNGTDSFAYRICDPAGECAVATVALTITPVNDAPIVPGPGTLTVNEEGSVEFDPLAGAVDVEGQKLFLLSYDSTSAQGGTITLGSLIYTPKADYSGPDSFSYVVSDGTDTTKVLVKVTVTGVNDAPRGTAAKVTTAEDTAVSFDPLAGFRDPDGDTMTAVLKALPFTTVEGGTVEAGADGKLTYTPKRDFNGTDRFDFAVTDGLLTSGATKVIEVTPVNDPPLLKVALDAEVKEDAPVGTVIGFVKEVTDVDSTSFTFSVDGFGGLLAVDTKGTITVNGILDFETAPDLKGTFAVSDGVDKTVVGAALKVLNVDEPPAGTAGVTFEVPDNVKPGTVIGQVPIEDPEGLALSFGEPKVVPAADQGAFSIDQKGAVVATPTREGFRFTEYTITVEAKDPAGNLGAVTFDVVIFDGTAPYGDVFMEWSEPFYEATGPDGQACPIEGGTKAVLSATIYDAWSGVAAVVARWALSVSGLPDRFDDVVLEEDKPGSGRFAGVIRFPFGTVPKGETGLVKVTSTATDNAGNVAGPVRLGEFTLQPCGGALFQ